MTHVVAVGGSDAGISAALTAGEQASSRPGPAAHGEPSCWRSACCSRRSGVERRSRPRRVQGDQHFADHQRGR
jgi:hypothetical protein